MVHYLTNSGKNNYAVDPINNRTLTYDSMQELHAKMLSHSSSRTTPSVEADAPASAPAAGSSAKKPRKANAVRSHSRGAAEAVGGSQEAMDAGPRTLDAGPDPEAAGALVVDQQL